MTDIEYFPAAIIGHFNKITKTPEDGTFKFFGNGKFKYDKLLYSFYYLQDRYKKLKSGSYFDHIGYDGIRMVDSGGFQVRTMGVNIQPDEVLKVYAREKVDIGVVLDYPMIDCWNENFVEKTLHNVQYMVENKSVCPDTKILNVLHGLTPADRKKYYKRFEHFNDKLDGWSAGLIKRLPPIFNAWSFLYILENDKTMKDKRYHFLGLTGNKNMPMVYYLAKLNLVNKISFDSTKYGREGMMYDMRNPSYMQERLSISQNAHGKLKDNKFCPCPICQSTDIKDMQTDGNHVILHNLFWEIKKFQFFDSFATAEDLKNHIMNNKEYDKSTKMAIKFIDYALEHGLDDAENKFRTELFVKPMTTTVKTLGDFN